MNAIRTNFDSGGTVDSKEEKPELREAGLLDERMSEKLEKLIYILAVGALREGKDDAK